MGTDAAVRYRRQTINGGEIEMLYSILRVEKQRESAGRREYREAEWRG